ncbi:MAG: UDP-glucose/GDP-mannose dehydrogenase family protein [Gammaproteobacteria bacterium]|nr:UDP-glucose/GDP-mannose dehydrogenase family protein [Gammaproteobacteria bacterium]
MNITIFGTGYVGLVTGACLADTGNNVLCIDIDDEKIALLNGGQIPIHEPGLSEIVHRNAEAGRLSFSSDAVAGVDHGLFQFIAVGTPPDEDGSADLQHVLAVAHTIGQHMSEYRIVVDKSTVPVGTADQVKAEIAKVLAARNREVDFDVVSNPEFLREGAAIGDFMKPDRIVVGTDNPRTTELLRMLYDPFTRNHDRLISMDVRSAELTKYAANAMLATRISFMNELANLAERVGADIEQVRVGIGSDPRIGYNYIYPGCGYGGSCFPKDVKALTHAASVVGYEAAILDAVEAVNDRQKTILYRKLHEYFDGGLRGKTIAVWGLAFKANTDDMREATSRVLMESLWRDGARVQAYDPVAMEQTRKIYGDRADMELCESAEAAVDGADALVIVTEWSEFRSPNFAHLKKSLRTPLIVDGRNLYDPDFVRQQGFQYLSIGRPA